VLLLLLLLLACKGSQTAEEPSCAVEVPTVPHLFEHVGALLQCLQLLLDLLQPGLSFALIALPVPVPVHQSPKNTLPVLAQLTGEGGQHPCQLLLQLQHLVLFCCQQRAQLLGLGLLLLLCGFQGSSAFCS